MDLPELNELKENFLLFGDWEERYRYLIDLGRKIPAMEEALKVDAHIVKGCTSRVWLVVSKSESRINIRADSDAHIVRGLIAIILSAYQNKSPDDIANIDIEGVFTEIGMQQHLSPNRRNGFFAMVERLKTLATH